tara:strand:+ start:334 stop:825 length:492 start_codon:yes stop_codon:yes gene_type:complete
MAKKEVKEKKSKKPQVCEVQDPKALKIIELTADLQHLQAEFENHKKYIAKQQADFAKYAKSEMIEKLLPILDSFDLAVQHKEDSENFVKGMELVISQFVTTLEQEGLQKMEALGKELDPHLHDVLMTEPSDKPDHTITKELQPGYMLNERVLRHAKVKVAGGK